MPEAVGVDIGCGMIAVRTQFAAADLPTDRKPLREAIEAAVPLSAGVYNQDVTRDHTVERIASLRTARGVAGFDPAAYARNWELQLGTLGSGNHFIEVGLDEQDHAWPFLHSGSRGVGNKIATHHIGVAQRQCTQRWITLPNPDLAYLVEGDDEFWAYIRELRWAPAVRPAEPRGDDGKGDRLLLQLGRRTRHGAGAHQLPPQLHQQRDALREEGVAVPKGRHRCQRRDAEFDPRVDGYSLVCARMWWRAWGIGWR